MNRFFTQPWWWCALPVAVAWVIWLHRTSDAVLSVGRRRWVLATRLLGVLCVILALAGLQWPKQVDRMNVVFLLDRSDSLPAAVQQPSWEIVRQWLAGKPPGDRAGMVVFGRDAAVEFLPVETPQWDRPLAVVDTSGTDLAEAIRLALAVLPEDGQKRLVLLSDGNETQGRVLDWLPHLRQRQVACDVVPLGTNRPGDVRVERTEVPARVGRQEPFDLKLWVFSPTQTLAGVRVYANDRLVVRAAVPLEPGKNLLRFPQRLEQAGFHYFEVNLDVAGDPQLRNNRGHGFVTIQGPPRVLVLHTSPEEELGPWLSALRSIGAELTVRAAAAAPEHLAGWQAFDAVVLENVSAADLPVSALEQLGRAVMDLGVGLLCVGGDQSFTAGGYRGTPLQEILPVSMDLDQWRPLPVVALMLVLDRSGSMVGEKLEMAKRAAMASVVALGQRDWVGVLAFDTQVYNVAPLQPATQRRAVLRALAQVQADGGTSIYPALEEAYRQLTGARAQLKHCVVLTDGITQPGDFETLATRMRQEGITVSTVGVGQDFDGAFLERLARWGGGRFYAAVQPSDLPQLFLRDTALLLRTALVEEEFEAKRAFSTEPLTGLPHEGWPRLYGYVATAPKPRAETPLQTHQNDPLLAHWQCGLGRVVAFTSDVRPRWAVDWMAWPYFSQFWAQLLQWSLRRLEPGLWTAQVRAEGETVRVWVEWDEEPDAFSAETRFQAVLVRPDGTRQVQEMDPLGPGLYEARFTGVPAGVCAVQVRQLEGERVRAAETLGLALSDSPELARTTPHLALLTRLAHETGGTVLQPATEGSSPFAYARKPVWVVRPLAPELLRLALCLFVLDIALRRLHFEREDWQALRRWVSTTLAAFRGKPVGGVQPAREPVLASLLARRHAVRDRWKEEAPGRGASVVVAEVRREAPAAPPLHPSVPTSAGSLGTGVVSSPAHPPSGPAVAQAEPAAASPGEEAVLLRLRQARLRARQKLGAPPDAGTSG